mmetsp:Transcript_57196/g.165751  ORF Transcript_57196/g.165751 Transcript_57196/m.165751 type:complete len:252 (+) Transcript_57196:313-1068(+)
MVVRREALVGVNLAMADPITNYIDHRAARNGARAAREHPERVGGEVVLPRHEAVDVFRCHGVVEALAPKREERGDPSDDADAHGGQVHPRDRAREANAQCRQVVPVAAELEAIAHTTGDHVAGTDKDEEDSEKLAFVHQVILALAAEERDLLIVESVEIRRERAFHDEVPDDVGHHERDQRGKPLLPLLARFPHRRRPHALLRACLAVVAAGAAGAARLADLRHNDRPEQHGADGQRQDNVPEQRLHRHSG